MPVCSICSAPGGSEAVNELLQKRTPLKEIAALSGFTKSSIHRHSHSCFVRRKAVSVKEMKFDALRDRVLTDSNDGSFVVQCDPVHPETNNTTTIELRLNDW